MDRRNSDVVMGIVPGSRKSRVSNTNKKKPTLTVEDLERVYGRRHPPKKTVNTNSDLPDRIQAAWNGSRSVAFTPEDWTPTPFENAQSEFETKNKANVHADAMAIRADLKRTLASVLDATESIVRLFFGLSIPAVLHREASAFVQRLLEDRLNILKALVKNAMEQAKKPLIVARLVFNTGCNYLGLPGHILRNFMDLVVDPVVRLWWQKQSRAKQEAFLDEAEACPRASPEERTEMAKVQSFFLSRMLSKFIVFLVDAKFDVRLDERAILREFFDKGSQRERKVAIARAIFMGTGEVDLKPLLGIIDVLDDGSIVKIFRAVRRQLQPLVPSRKTRVLPSNGIGNLNARTVVNMNNYGAFSVF